MNRLKITFVLAFLCIANCISHGQNVAGPESPVSYLALANGLYDRQLFDSAEVVLSHAAHLTDISDSLRLELLSRLGDIYLENLDYGAADSALRWAYEISIAEYGLQTRETARVLCLLQGLADFSVSNDSAISIAARVQSIIDPLFSPGDTGLVYFLNEIGGAYAKRKSSDTAKEVLEEAVELMTQSGHPESPTLIETYAYLNEYYTGIDDSVALDYALKGVKIAQANTDGWERLKARLYMNTGDIIRTNLQDNELALEYYGAADSLLTSRYGSKHILREQSLLSLGTTLGSLGNYEGASEAIQAVLELERGNENALFVASVQHELATLYHTQGRYNDAIEHYRLSIQLHNKISGEPDRNYITSIMSLGSVYSDLKQFDSAVTIMTRGIALFDSIDTREPLLRLRSEAMLASCYFDRGDSRTADSLYDHVLETCRDSLADDAPIKIEVLRQIADDYRQAGRYSKSEGMWLQCLQSDAKRLPADHPLLVVDYISLAAIYAFTGEVDKSADYFSKAVRSRYDFISNIFLYASEKQKLAYLARNRLIVEPFFSLALSTGNDKAIHGSWEMLLKGKGIVIDALAANRRFAACSSDEEVARLREQHSHICESIANMTLSFSQPGARVAVDSLSAIKDSIETQLGSHCKRVNHQYLWPTLCVEDIIQRIPHEAVFIDFIEYRPYDFSRSGRDDKLFNSQHYLAFVVDHAGTINMSDLGESAVIDSVIHQVRSAIHESRTQSMSATGSWAEQQLKRQLSELYNSLIAPLEMSIDNHSRLIISPDGALNFLPFEILTDTEGQYAITKYRISYVTAGRDLRRFTDSPVEMTDAILVGDPNFDVCDSLDGVKNVTATLEERLSQLSGSQFRGQEGCLSTPFAALPYSRKEVTQIAALLGTSRFLDPIVYTDSRASERMLKSITTGPTLLHLASHAFVCSDSEDVGIAGKDRNPLLRCGLLLAGANQVIEHRGAVNGGQDGVLTGLEASTLNLSETELVTLSGCETALGDALYADGVAGLRRAFQLAGAKSTVMSLWTVPDRETTEFMVRFYQLWAQGHSKADALRKAALERMDEIQSIFGHTHPYLWSSFVLYGSPN